MGAPPSPPWPTAAILRHDCPDGTWHYDWLLAVRPPVSLDDRCALAWRMQLRPDHLAPGTRVTLAAQPLHRAHYLALDAPAQLSDDRGRVEPVASGRIAEGGLAADGCGSVSVHWRGGARVEYRFTNEDGRACVECVRSEPMP